MVCDRGAGLTGHINRVEPIDYILIIRIRRT